VVSLFRKIERGFELRREVEQRRVDVSQSRRQRALELVERDARLQWRDRVVALAYAGLALSTTAVGLLAVPFVLAGLGIGAAETAEHAAVASLAPADVRGSAFGVLAAVQSAGNVAASAVAGILWTVFSPSVAFTYLTVSMLLALLGLADTARRMGRPGVAL